MARLFFTLYIGMIGAIFALFFTIDLVAKRMAYDLEARDVEQTLGGYIELFQEIHVLAGSDAMFAAMQRTAKINNQLLSEVTDIKLLESKSIRNLPKPGIFHESLDPNDDEVIYFRLNVNDKVYQITPDQSAEIWRVAEMLSLAFLGGFFLITALALGIWIYLLHNKLKKLERSAIRIADGDFSARAPTTFKHRVGGLNRAFNLMAERVEQLIASHKRLTNAVAHELRTPIFRLRCQLELLEHGIDVAEHNRFVNGMDEDLTELDQMVDELLSYARMERSGGDVLVLKSHELNQWLLERHEGLERNCRKSLMLKTAKPVVIEYDERLILRALTNLIRNADKFAQQRIELSINQQAGFAVICVEDDGVGIPEADRERVFEPFERVDNARTRESGGHGLGLSIVREIVAQHEGYIQISESSLGGARIEVYLPLMLPQP
ncbi:ATP-binding protein [Amphritea japonica]|uniref:histidine kinase n=1 Tax=Amphritea japonica ATCC BAA-1530 TaxID=1278309 RepID=A0A7R6PM01_9GAMM|nr:ATP-binding protein [Amphritea japonica]BBB25903.1 two-component system, OmpR family, sensor histidine kinase RstB [Amphritea japonica ATCC BAA-1530]